MEYLKKPELSQLFQFHHSIDIDMIALVAGMSGWDSITLQAYGGYGVCGARFIP